jgi:hypothetical protein
MVLESWSQNTLAQDRVLGDDRVREHIEATLKIMASPVKQSQLKR